MYSFCIRMYSFFVFLLAIYAINIQTNNNTSSSTPAINILPIGPIPPIEPTEPTSNVVIPPIDEIPTTTTTTAKITVSNDKNEKERTINNDINICKNCTTKAVKEVINQRVTNFSSENFVNLECILYY